MNNNKFRYKSFSLHLNDEEKIYIYFLHAMSENQILCFLVFHLHYQNKFHKFEVKLTLLFLSAIKKLNVTYIDG
jgi:hypothetical protein